MAHFQILSLSEVLGVRTPSDESGGVILFNPGGGNGSPLQYSCLENSMDRGAWWVTVHGVTKSCTRLSDLSLFNPYSIVQVSTYQKTCNWGGGITWKEIRVSLQINRRILDDVPCWERPCGGCDSGTRLRSKSEPRAGTVAFWKYYSKWSLC